MLRRSTGVIMPARRREMAERGGTTPPHLESLSRRKFLRHRTGNRFTHPLRATGPDAAQQGEKRALVEQIESEVVLLDPLPEFLQCRPALVTR
jgi:hypothetical protein